MNYRQLGRTGIKISELSLGSWVTFHNQSDLKSVIEMMAAAYDAGVNFFDNAEAYAGGKSEELMGQALRELGWRRGSYLVSTKLFWGLNDGPNERNTLNRKYLVEAIDGSLQRLGLDHVDLIFCHRPDVDTPIEETVRALVEAGADRSVGSVVAGNREVLLDPCVLTVGIRQVSTQNPFLCLLNPVITPPIEAA